MWRWCTRREARASVSYRFDSDLRSQSRSSERSGQSKCPSHWRKMSTQLPSPHCISSSEHIGIGRSISSYALVSALLAHCRVNYTMSQTRQNAQLSQRGRATFRVVENLAVTQGHSKLHRWVGRCKIISVLHYNIISFPFLRHSTSNNGVPLKYWLGVIQGYWKGAIW